MNGRERYLAAVRGDRPDHLPNIGISMMIAADLVGVPYRAYATDYRELVKGQLAFAEKHGIDHVSVISDPAVEASDCGARVVYYDNHPPAVDESASVLADKQVLSRLPRPSGAVGERMANRVRGVEELSRQARADRIIEGWVEGPVAEACDLRGINRFMIDVFDDPAFVGDLLDYTYELGVAFARAQVEAGADVVGVGDAASSLLGGALYEEFVLPRHKRLAAAIHEMGALMRLHICGDSSFVCPHLEDIGADIMDLDSLVPVAVARQRAGARPILSGNIDPVRVLKDGSPADVHAALAACLEGAGGSRYMVAAGCEIDRATPPENLQAMTEFARGTTWS